MPVSYRFTNVRILNTQNNQVWTTEGGNCRAVGGMDEGSATEIIATVVPNNVGGNWVGPTLTGKGDRGEPRYSISANSPENPPRHVDFTNLRCTRVSSNDMGYPWSCTFAPRAGLRASPERQRPARPRAQVTNNIPGADSLGWGFDIFGQYGDSSLKGQLFEMTGGTVWTDPITNVNYQVPANVALDARGKTDTQHQVFDTATQVQEYFAAKAHLEASYVSEFGAFTGAFNSAYQHGGEQISEYKYALFESEFIAWSLALRSQSLSHLTAEVQTEIAALPAEFSRASRAAFFRFVRRYGTHYVSQVAVGGRLYYYVSVEKSYTSDDTRIDADVTLEYNAVLISGKAEAKAEWAQLGQSWVSNRTVNIKTVGGAPDILLVAVPEYGDNHSDLFKQWVDSIKTNPAAMDFVLRPISNLMPAEKVAAMEAALHAYVSDNLLVVEARSRVLSFPEPSKPGDLPVVTLGEAIQPEAPPQHNFGFLMIILKPIDDDFDVDLIGYYSADLYAGDGGGYTRMFDAMLADIRTGNYSQPGYILVLASFDWDWQAPPTADFYAFLRSAGAGDLLQEWYDGVISPGSISGLNSLYILVGPTGAGPNQGVEALGKGGPQLEPIHATVTVRLDGLNLQQVNISDTARRARLEQRQKELVP